MSDNGLTVGRVTFGPSVLSKEPVEHNSRFLASKYGELQAKSEFLSARQCPDHSGKWERGRCLQCEIERLQSEVRALEEKRVELNVTIGERDAEIERLRGLLREARLNFEHGFIDEEDSRQFVMRLNAELVESTKDTNNED